MKIKIKKQLNLPQLIEWAGENWITNQIIRADKQLMNVQFDVHGDFCTYGFTDINTTFTVEVEEEVTEDTVFPSLVVVRDQHFASGNSTVHVTKINNKSVNSLIGKQPNNSTFEYKEIYLMDDDKLGQCIWRDGKLVE